MTFNVDVPLVRKLVASQFPKWKDLTILPVKTSGWDNRTFHLGSRLLARLPSQAIYESQVEKEGYWLPKLGPKLPFEIPQPLAMGKPNEDYPLKWSIYQWIEGTSLAEASIDNHETLAIDLAHFLTIFQSLDSKDGPKAGLHSFYRGGSLSVYDNEVRKALEILTDKIDTQKALQLWEKALQTSWQRPPVWVHGDLSAGNLLVREGKLAAVIDFGQLAIGDPACDLTVAWTVFQGKSRTVFRTQLKLDPDTWLRAQAWTLWKALIAAAGFIHPNNTESKKCLFIIEEVLADKKVV